MKRIMLLLVAAVFALTTGVAFAGEAAAPPAPSSPPPAEKKMEAEGKKTAEKKKTARKAKTAAKKMEEEGQKKQ